MEGGRVNDEFTIVLVGVLLFAAVITGGNFLLNEFSVSEDLPGLEAGQELAEKTNIYRTDVEGVSEVTTTIGVWGLLNLIKTVFVDGIQFSASMFNDVAKYLGIPTSFMVFILAVVIIILTIAAIRFLRGVRT